ncbi:PIN domain-containing protein [Salinibacter ruber]|uniref:PIN domain-containing protein n=1 Tax=Salinibacter ruber TaxID=146919 RepID=UPI003C6E2CE6
MTGIDTNVLVRYVTRDHPEQYRAAKRHLESSCTQEEPGYVSVIVSCELAWVLGPHERIRGRGRRSRPGH